MTMELLDRYLHALKSYLPKDQQRDILDEISDAIQSEAEERQNALGRALSREEEAELIKRYGHPMLAAARYKPQQYLIGPALFPYFVATLKFAAGILLLLHVIFAIAMGFTSPNPVASGLRALGGLWDAIPFWIAFITVIFAILERNQVRLRLFEHWDPGTLPPVPAPRTAEPQRIPWSESIVGLVAATVMLLYWLGVPPLDRLVFGGDAMSVRVAPELLRLHTPITMMLLMVVAGNILNIVRPYFTHLHGISRLVTDAVGLTILYVVSQAPKILVIVNAAGEGPGQYARQEHDLNRLIAAILVIPMIVFIGDIILNIWRLAGRPGDHALRQTFHR
jgi:hypothetical protein